MFLIQSCLSTASVSDFPKTSKTYDFNKIANSAINNGDKSYDSKTGFEYYLKTNITNDSIIISSIKAAFGTEKFSIEFIDTINGAIIGKRGIKTTGNEWNCISAVYFKKIPEGFDMYIKFKITQDLTGGWKRSYSEGQTFYQFSGGREDGAKQIGEIICKLLKNCLQSYTVSTMMKH